MIAEYIAQQLERRVSFRRVVRQSIQRAQRAGVQGIKIQVGGRLNGAEIARTEWTREGRVPLHTLRADIDYSCCTAKTIYGILGIKVWVFKGEIIPGQEELLPNQQPEIANLVVVNNNAVANNLKIVQMKDKGGIGHGAWGMGHGKNLS